MGASAIDATSVHDIIGFARLADQIGPFGAIKESALSTADIGMAVRAKATARSLSDMGIETNHLNPRQMEAIGLAIVGEPMPHSRATLDPIARSLHKNVMGVLAQANEDVSISPEDFAANIESAIDQSNEDYTAAEKFGFNTPATTNPLNILGLADYISVTPTFSVAPLQALDEIGFVASLSKPAQISAFSSEFSIGFAASPTADDVLGTPSSTHPSGILGPDLTNVGGDGASSVGTTANNVDGFRPGAQAKPGDQAGKNTSDRTNDQTHGTQHPGVDGNGGSTGGVGQSGQQGPSAGQRGTDNGGRDKPVAFDLNNDGAIDFVSIDDSTAFYDLDGEGYREHIAWVGPNDGLLAYDKDSDGLIVDGDEISFVDYLAGAETDLEGLAFFDTHDADGNVGADGILTVDDAEWAKFGVWQDLDQDGETDEGEFTSLDDMGITEINLTSDGVESTAADGDVTIFGVGEYKRNGETEVLADAALAISSMGFRENANGSIDFNFDEENTLFADYAGHAATIILSDNGFISAYGGGWR